MSERMSERERVERYLVLAQQRKCQERWAHQMYTIRQIGYKKTNNEK